MWSEIPSEMSMWLFTALASVSKHRTLGPRRSLREQLRPTHQPRSWPHGGEARLTEPRPIYKSLVDLPPRSQKTVDQTTPLSGIWAPARPSPSVGQDPALQAWELQALASRTHASCLSQELVAAGTAPRPAWGGGCGRRRAALRASGRCRLPFKSAMRQARSHLIPRATPERALSASPGAQAGWVPELGKENVRSSLIEVSADGGKWPLGRAKWALRDA